MPGHEESISQQQFIWLENDLKNISKEHIFVLVHAPLYPLGPHEGESLDKYPNVRDRLASLLIQYGVDVVFNGHEHFYASFEYNGIMQATSGGAGGKLRSPTDFEALSDKFGYDTEKIARFETEKILHYLSVTTSDGLIEITAYDLQGNIIDQFSVAS